MEEDSPIFAFSTFRSDKLRWISALSRPHPEIDFSAAEGEAMLLGLDIAKLTVFQKLCLKFLPTSFPD